MRDVTDPRMLRAMAHPLRLKMLNQLAVFGPATATELAEKLDDSAANCSWHLRQLAKFGLIEEATDLPSTGRNRPWRWIPKGNRWDDSAPELAMASDELMTAMLRMELDERRAWESTQLSEKAEWRDAAFTHQSVAYLTAEELAGVNAKIRDLILQNIERLTDPKTRPEGARPIRFVAWGVPACEQS